LYCRARRLSRHCNELAGPGRPGAGPDSAYTNPGVRCWPCETTRARVQEIFLSVVSVRRRDQTIRQAFVSGLWWCSYLTAITAARSPARCILWALTMARWMSEGGLFCGIGSLGKSALAATGDICRLLAISGPNGRTFIAFFVLRQRFSPPLKTGHHCPGQNTSDSTTLLNRQRLNRVPCLSY
jgi:hypothetical protein